MTSEIEVREPFRLIYVAWKTGARLRSEDIERLAEAGGLTLSHNRLRELGRQPSDRGLPISHSELLSLMLAWSAEQRATSTASSAVSRQPAPADHTIDNNAQPLEPKSD